MKAQKKNKTIRIPDKLLGKPFGNNGLSAVLEEINVAKPFNRAEIARRVCRRLNWKSPGGNYQYMSARVGLLKLHRAGIIKLPPPIRGNGNGGKLKPVASVLPKIYPITLPVHELKNLQLQRVVNAEQSAIYNAMMDRYHYLGYIPMAGAQVRYLFHWEGGLLGAIGFGASAWKISPRDQFIGWVPSIREKKLHLVVNNSRFLILPEVHSANLASKILAMCARRIPDDYRHLYGYSPVLLETFVEQGRFRGTCYKAANWQCVGQTQGRGKKHKYKTPGIAVKDIWLYPLRRDFSHILQSEECQ